MVRNIMRKIKEVLVRAGHSEGVAITVRYVLVRPSSERDVSWAFPKGWDENHIRNDHRGDVYVLDIAVVCYIFSSPALSVC